MVPESAPPCFKGHVKREAEVRPGSYDNAGAYAYGLKAVDHRRPRPAPSPLPPAATLHGMDRTVSYMEPRA